MDKGKDIAREAEKNKGSTSWAYAVEAYQRGNNKYFPKNSWKCNLFVHDMLYDAGVDPPPRTPGGWPATAAMWTHSIPGFHKVNTQNEGDVVSNGKHCGIAVSSSQVLAGNTDSVGEFDFGSSSTIQRMDQ